MEDSTLIVGIPAARLEDLIAGAVLKGLAAYHSERETTTEPLQEELLTRKEAAKLLGITLPTLREYTRRDLISGYRIGTRVRYKRNELIDSLKQITASRVARRK